MQELYGYIDNLDQLNVGYSKLEKSKKQLNEDGEIILISRQKKLHKPYKFFSWEHLLTLGLLILYILTNMVANDYLQN